MPIQAFASRLTTRGWLIVGAAAVASVLFVYLFVHTVSQPSYTMVVSGVDPARTGKMTSALSAKGINYQLQNNGTAIAVQNNQTANARVALAGAGLLGSSQTGFELFDHTSLGESTFQQQVTYQRALQGQLQETIDSVQGVSGATVTLVLPNSQNQVFGEGQTASAAVLLSGTNGLDPSAVRGIAQLVASSVPGLTLAKVTITDGSGALLWPASGGAGAGGGGGGSAKQEAQQRYNQSMAASLDAMLAQTVGAGKSQVLVYANMNVNQTTQEALTYGKAGVPLQQSKQVESLQGSGGGAGGVAGTAGQGTTGTSKSGNYKKESVTSTLGVDKTVTHSTIAPGTIESQHVSVLLDKSVPASAIPAIKEAVSNAAGIQASRGDTISIGQVAFAKTEAAAAGSSGGIMADAKYALLAIAAALFLFFTTRALRRREQEPIEDPVWLRELQAPVRLSELERETAPRPAPALAASTNGNGTGSRGGGDEIRRQVEQLAENDPDVVAQQLRSWMQEG